VKILFIVIVTRKSFVSDVKKTQKAKITGPSDAKSYECEVCQCAVTAVGTEDRH